MSGADRPGIEVGNIMTLWCNRHWKPYHGKARHATIAALAMLKQVLADERFMRACGWNPDTGAEADIERASAELAKIKPTCCFLGDTAMDEIWLQVLIQVRGGKLQ